MIGLTVNHAQIEFGQMIGHGSFGCAYKGRWQGKDVALKWVDISLELDREQVIANNRELQALNYEQDS